MTDIVERLRKPAPSPLAYDEREAFMLNERDRHEAADEIERLRSLCENITHDNELLIRKIMEFEPHWKIER